MDRAFKIIGALGLSLSAGALLGMTTPVAMKDAPEAGWRMAARGASPAAALPPLAAPVVYSALPEDLSPAVGYGSPAAYQARYVDAPVRTGYTSVPADAEAAAAAVPAPDPAARTILADSAAHGAPVTLATAKTVSMPDPAADPAFDPVFDQSGDAPAMDAGGED